MPVETKTQFKFFFRLLRTLTCLSVMHIYVWMNVLFEGLDDSLFKHLFIYNYVCICNYMQLLVCIYISIYICVSYLHKTEIKRWTKNHEGGSISKFRGRYYFISAISFALRQYRQNTLALIGRENMSANGYSITVALFPARKLFCKKSTHETEILTKHMYLLFSSAKISMRL